MNDVGARGEAMHDGAAGFGLEIDRDAALVAVRAEKHGALSAAERRPAPRLIAGAGRLDLDDLGAEVAQILGAERAREHLGEVENADAGQSVVRRAHAFLP